MTLNEWQHRFLHRLVELGGSISVPDGVVNQELIELTEADYVVEGDGGGGRTYYKITNAGRAAIKQSLGQWAHMMSALSLKAVVRRSLFNVRYVPTADISPVEKRCNRDAIHHMAQAPKLF